jgi:hypothetical protein
MTNYKITFTGGANGLYTRRITTQAVAAQDAVEAIPAKGVPSMKTYEPAVEAKEAVPYKSAEWEYVPFVATFEFSSDDASDYEAGSSLFSYWFENEDGSDTLSDLLNIMVEKEAKSFNVSYSKRFDAEVTAELAAANDLSDEYEVESWLDNNGDGELDYPDDTGELSDIAVEENSGEFVEVEWNG